MKCYCTLEPSFRRNQRLIKSDRGMPGKIVHVGAGIVAEDAGFRPGDEPWTRPGIEGFALFRGKYLRRAQITALVSVREMEETVGIRFCRCINICSP